MRRNRSAIEDAAAEWLGRRDGGLAPAQEAELAAWLGADPRHAAAFARMAAASTVLDGLAAFRPDNGAEPDPDLALPPAGPRRKRIWIPVTLAAAAAVVLAYVGEWRSIRADRSGYSRNVATRVGALHQQSLPDGSVVTLNTDSAIEVDFRPEERRVRLIRGEALFAVAKSAARPFIVYASGVAVKAVGTAFNVRLHAESVEVLVTEGKVSVAGPTTPIDKARQSTEPGPKRPPSLVSAGQRIVVSAPPRATSAAASEATDPASVDAAEIARLLAWQQRKLEFGPMPLERVVAEFNRYNHRQLALADAATGAVRVGGSFRADDPDTFVRLLESSFDIEVDRQDDKTVLRLRR